MIFGSRYIGASDTVERIYLWGARSFLVEHEGNVGGLVFWYRQNWFAFFRIGIAVRAASLLQCEEGGVREG